MERQLIAQSHLQSRAFGVLFLITAAGSALVSVLLQSFAAWPIFCGLAAGTGASLVALLTHRLGCSKVWVTMPAVFLVTLGLQLTKSHFTGPQSALFFQYGGVAIAVYGAAWFFGIAGLGHGQPEP